MRALAGLATVVFEVGVPESDAGVGNNVPGLPPLPPPQTSGTMSTTMLSARLALRGVTWSTPSSEVGLERETWSGVGLRLLLRPGLGLRPMLRLGLRKELCVCS